MPGSIFKMVVQEGDSVKEGDVLLIMEAMKMEMDLKSPVSGTVTAIDVAVGDQVQAGATLVHIA